MNTMRQKDETRAGFGRQGAGFEVVKPFGSDTAKCATAGRAGQALAMLVLAGPNGVTQAEALSAGNGWRLAASVHTLRCKGFRIHTHRVYRAKGGWYARYELLGGVQHGR
ncbi:MAG: hypothetical protein C0445_05725 [Polaromonas sp.]|nr:hypothetical protein [Polaromonas sp.]